MNETEKRIRGSASEAFRRLNPQLFGTAEKDDHEANNESASKQSKPSKWNDDEIESMRSAYKDPFGVNLPLLAELLGRTHASVACKAHDLGICCNRGKQIRTSLALKNMALSSKQMHENNPEIALSQSRRMKGKPSLFLGRNHTKESKLAQSARAKAWIKTNGHPKGMLGVHHSEETKTKISQMKSGIPIPQERVLRSIKTKVERYGSQHFQNLGKVSWKHGWRTIGGVRIYARSRWEANYARYLEFLKRHGEITSWEHEPETFWFENVKRGSVSYLPDFRVTMKSGCVEYHEVKGWMDRRSKTKIKRMAKYFPAIKLLIIGADWFKRNRIKLSSLLPDWEKS